MRSFDVETRDWQGVSVVGVTGTVDAVTAPRLSAALQGEVAAGRPRLVVDFGGTEYVSSAGLRAILAAVKAARVAGGDLAVAAAQPQVREVFELAGMMEIVTFYDEVDAAVTGLG